jgi:hypothetical protein
VGKIWKELGALAQKQDPMNTLPGSPMLLKDWKEYV